MDSKGGDVAGWPWEQHGSKPLLGFPSPTDGASTPQHCPTAPHLLQSASCGDLLPEEAVKTWWARVLSYTLVEAPRPYRAVADRVLKSVHIPPMDVVPSTPVRVFPHCSGPQLGFVGRSLNENGECGASSQLQNKQTNYFFNSTKKAKKICILNW